MSNDLEGLELHVVRDPNTNMIAKMCLHFPGEAVVEKNAEMIEAQREIEQLREQLAEQQMAKIDADMEKIDRRMDDIGHVPLIVEDPVSPSAAYTPLPSQPKTLIPIDLPDTAAQRAQKALADIESRSLKVKTKGGKTVNLVERKPVRRQPKPAIRFSAELSGTRLDSIMADIDNKLAGL